MFPITGAASERYRRLMLSYELNYILVCEAHLQDYVLGVGWRKGLTFKYA